MILLLLLDGGEKLITDIQFVDIWQKSKSPQEVSNKTGLSLRAIYKRVSRYRRRGIPLKYFRLRPDVAELIKRAEQL